MRKFFILIFFTVFFASCASNHFIVRHKVVVVPKKNEKHKVLVSFSGNVFLNNIFISQNGKKNAFRKEIETYFHYIFGNDVNFKTTSLKSEDFKNYETVVYLHFKTNYTKYQTYLLEFFSVFPGFVFFPVPTPQWGKVSVDADLKIVKNGKFIFEKNIRKSEPFYLLFYGLLREDPQVGAGNICFNEIMKELYQDKTLLSLYNFQSRKVVEEGRYTPWEDESLDYFRVLNEIEYKPLLISFLPLQLNVDFSVGISTANVYDKKDDLIASGTGVLSQNSIYLSSPDFNIGFYASPTLGYFFRRLNTSDFGESLNVKNTDIPSYIQGEVKDEKTNLSTEIFSLSYNSEFHSVFLGADAGYRLLLGTNSFQFLLNPFFNFNMIEWRKSVFKSLNAVHSTDSSFIFAGSWGGGFSTGFLFHNMNFGLIFGYKFNYFRAFRTPTDLRFKKTVLTTKNFDGKKEDIFVSKEITPFKSSLTSNLFTFKIFFTF